MDASAELILKMPAELYHLARQERCVALVRRGAALPFLGKFTLRNSDSEALWMNGEITRFAVTTMQHLTNADAAACGFMHLGQLLDDLRMSNSGISVEEPITIYYWGTPG